MTCAKQTKWGRECGAVWRDGLCFRHHPEQRPPDGERNNTPRRTVITYVSGTPGRQERAVAASLAARKGAAG